MVYSDYQKQRILYWFREGCTSYRISFKLAEEGIKCSPGGITSFLARFEETGSLEARRPSNKRRSQVEEIVRAQLQLDSSIGGPRLQAVLAAKGHTLSRSTVLLCRNSLLGSTQLRDVPEYSRIREQNNKIKRLTWAKENLKEDFRDVIWTSERCVELHSPSRRRHSTKPLLTVYAWGGISHRGRTGLCVYEGTMNSPLYVEMLEKVLVPFVREAMPSGHRLMQTNNSIYGCWNTAQFCADKGINLWSTPPHSPDLNPIGNLWSDLKDYIQEVTRPSTKEELLAGIVQFWRDVDVKKCREYIGRLKEVMIPAVIEQKGGATRF